MTLATRGEAEQSTSSAVPDWLAELADPDQLYKALGVRRVIHAAGNTTSFGGSRVRPEAWPAMQAAAQRFCDLAELNRTIGRFIASITGAEAAMVTSGAASAQVLAAAACLTGNDRGRALLLPDTGTRPNEIVIQRAHRGQFSNMYALSGARLVEIGNMNTCFVEEFETAITDRTAAVAFLYASGIRQIGPSLPETVKIAHAHDLPVIVDAAGMLPPKANLQRFIDEGADLVQIGSGKFMRAPQNTGILFGREDLIEAAMLSAAPAMAIGRPHKVAREDIVGLYVALRLFWESDEDASYERLRRLAQYVASRLDGLDGIGVAVEEDDFEFFVPTTVIRFAKDWPGPDVAQLATLLLSGEPRIFLYHDLQKRRLTVNPASLYDDDHVHVADRIRELVTRAVSADV